MAREELSKQKRNLPLCVSKEISAGKTYIVTGANTGLGYEAAKHLVAVDAAKVILAVRNLEAGEAAKAKIEEATKTKGIAEVWPLDLSSYASVQAFAKAAASLDRLDAVIENAGVASSQRTLAEGHVLPITVNVLSTFLLAVLLLPQLSASAKKYGTTNHLTLVISGTIFDVEQDWPKVRDDPVNYFDKEGNFDMKSYPVSKLITTFAARGLASALPVSRTGVVINQVDPGLCITDLSRNAPPAFQEQLKKMHAAFGRTAEDGSRTLLFGAVAGPTSHGHFLDACEDEEEDVPDFVKNGKDQETTWGHVAKELETAAAGSVKAALAI